MILDLLRTRRSIRKYEAKNVEKEKIEKALQGALLSETAVGKKSWNFIVVDDKALLKELSTCKAAGSGFLAEAAFGIVVLSNLEEAAAGVWIEDASIASDNIQLVLTEEGIGSCWIQVRERKDNMGKPSENTVRKVLQIPHNFAIESIIAAGYPAESKDPYSPDDVEWEKVHKNGFGTPYKA